MMYIIFSDAKLVIYFLYQAFPNGFSIQWGLLPEAIISLGGAQWQIYNSVVLYLAAILL